jgi:hypothetical protein
MRNDQERDAEKKKANVELDFPYNDNKPNPF